MSVDDNLVSSSRPSSASLLHFLEDSPEPSFGIVEADDLFPQREVLPSPPLFVARSPSFSSTVPLDGGSVREGDVFLGCCRFIFVNALLFSLQVLMSVRLSPDPPCPWVLTLGPRRREWKITGLMIFGVPGAPG